MIMIYCTWAYKSASYVRLEVHAIERDKIKFCKQTYHLSFSVNKSTQLLFKSWKSNRSDQFCLLRLPFCHYGSGPVHGIIGHSMFSLNNIIWYFDFFVHN